MILPNPTNHMKKKPILNRSTFSIRHMCSLFLVMLVPGYMLAASQILFVTTSKTAIATTHSKPLSKGKGPDTREKPTKKRNREKQNDDHRKRNEEQRNSTNENDKAQYTDQKVDETSSSSFRLDQLPPLKLEMASFPWPVIHVVQSRFQIGQGSFEELAKARFQLFRQYTWPSMQQQLQPQQFLWLIHVDGELPKNLLQSMIDLVKTHPFHNFYLVSDTTKSGRFPLRTFDDPKFLQGIQHATIHTGDPVLLQQAIQEVSKQRKSTAKAIQVSTTRLDMDDALNVQYLSRIQQTVRQVYGKNKQATPPKFLFWCVGDALEWHYVQEDSQNNHGGAIERHHYRSKCPSMGLTVVGTPPPGLGLGEHTLLKEKLYKLPKQESCGWNHNEDCVMVYEDLPGFRSRAPTSNSYLLAKDWESEQERYKNAWNSKKQRKMAQEVLEHFGIDTNDRQKSSLGPAMQQVNDYFSEHLCAIVDDFASSYCKTAGFTCYDKVTKAYQELKTKLKC